jgi:hypothetical protein
MIKGETLKIQVDDAAATAVVIKLGGPETKSITAQAHGSEWTASTSTSAWAPGFYEWQAWASYEDGRTSVIWRGNFKLEDALGIGDRRSTAQRNIEAIQTMLEGNAGEGVRRYRINNRELERYSVAELLQLLSYWKAELKREERAEAGRSTLGPRIAVRF